MDRAWRVVFTNPIPSASSHVTGPLPACADERLRVQLSSDGESSATTSPSREAPPGVGIDAVARKMVHLATLRARSAQDRHTICTEPSFLGTENCSAVDFSHQAQTMVFTLEWRQANAFRVAGAILDGRALARACSRGPASH